MSYNGAGVYTLPTNNITDGTTADAADVTTPLTDLETALNQVVLRNGVTAFSGNQSMGSNKLTGLAAATAASDAARLDQAQIDAVSHAASVGGTVDAITLTFSPAFTAYTSKMRFRWTSAGVNTSTTPTVNLDGLGAKTIKRNDGTALAADDTGVSGRICDAVYNGTDVILLNPASRYADLASANVFTTNQTIGKADAVTNAVTDVLAIRHTTSGTAAAGFGTGFVYRLEDGGGTTTDAASIDAVWVDATDTSEDSKISFKTMVAGAAKAEAAYFGQGLVVGAATGGDQGAGTVNATALYINGVALTPYTNAVRATDSSITTNTVLASDSTLKFAMLANTAYDFEAWLLLDVDADSGWKLGITGPAAPTEVFVTAQYFDDNSNNRGSSATSYTQLDANTPGADRNACITIKGLIRNGANAGDFALQFAQNVNHATAFIIKRGSRLSYRVNA